MGYSPKQFNRFMFYKLPAAWWTGVRLSLLKGDEARARVRYRWANQNPFGSMFWAVQGMAAELTTGALVMDNIKASGKSISMLVAHNKGSFTKKAKGRIEFRCTDGGKVGPAIEMAVNTGEGQTFWMQSVGTDASGDVVATFDFEWTIKLRSPKKNTRS